MQLVSETVAFKNALESQLSEMRSEEWRYQSKLGAEQLNSYVSLYERALDRSGKLLTDVARLGLEAKRVALAEEQARWLLGQFQASVDATGLEPSLADRLRAEFAKRLDSHLD